MSLTGARVVVQMRRVPDCPHIARVRELVRRVATETGVPIELEEVVGNFPSPTVVIGGRDVTGEPLGEGASCRLDLPTEEQVRAALRLETTTHVA